MRVFFRLIRHLCLLGLDLPIWSHLSDKKYLELKFFAFYGRRLDLRQPRTFNEKIQWLKLYDRKEIYKTLVDKAEVKKYVASILGDSVVIPTYHVWDTESEIDFKSLPDQFVLKCTHDSSSVVICRDKRTFDEEKAKKRLSFALKKNFYSAGREWAYKGLTPRIIAEKYIVEHNGGISLCDYKFFCFNGSVKCFKVDFDRFTDHKANYYDPFGNYLPFEEIVCPSDPSREIVLPDNLPEMIKIAERLAQGLPFVRVDLYNVDGFIYFGEMTFYPASGFDFFHPSEWDLTLGQWLNLPTKEGD